MNKLKRQNSVEDEEARHWVVLLADSEPSSETLRAFDHWIEDDPSHHASYEDALRVWNAFEHIPRLREMARESKLARFASPQPASTAGEARPFPRMRKRSLWFGSAAAIIVLALAALLMRDVRDHSNTAYATQVAEIRDIRLSDGSVVTLGARSKIEVSYGGRERRVSLLAGEAFFSVVKDSSRPFLAVADDTVVRVLGTQFEIHRGVEQVRVAVAEGRVEVVGRGEYPFIESSGRKVYAMALTQGQEVTTRNRHVEPVRTIAGSPVGAWREGRLYYKDARLVDVVADASRYYNGRIQLASPDIGALRITGTFQTDRVDQLLENLEQILPIAIERDGSGAVTLKSRP